MWLVELAGVNDGEAVLDAVVAALSIRPHEGASLSDALVDWFHGRQLLLLLDNCEHVLAAAHDVLGTILTRCPTVRVVATSRQPVAVAGERVFQVNVLEAGSDAVSLFLDRAAAADHSFEADDAQLGVIADICRRLDGIPLAIELAAARVRSMSMIDLRARLDDRFRVLRSSSDLASGRHATLLAAVEWSYRLLDHTARTTFDRLSVFAGSFDLEAAEAVCADQSAGGGRYDIVDLVSELVDKSLVIAERHSEITRYRLLETIREFAAQQLHDAGQSDACRERHLHHYLVVAERSDSLYRTPHQVAASLIFEREWNNLRRAHDWAVDSGDLPVAHRLLWATRLFAFARMRVEHREWCQRTLAADASNPSADVQTLTSACNSGLLWGRLRRR